MRAYTIVLLTFHNLYRETWVFRKPNVLKTKSLIILRNMKSAFYQRAIFNEKLSYEVTMVIKLYGLSCDFYLLKKMCLKHDLSRKNKNFGKFKSKITRLILFDSLLQEIVSSDGGIEYIPIYIYILTIKIFSWARGLGWELEYNDIYRQLCWKN